MQTASAAYLAAQAQATRHPKMKLQMVLRNIAAAAEGGLATGSGPFSADYPAAGAIDGDRTHLNWGPAAGADNGIGKGGWKSDLASSTVTKTSAADWGSDQPIKVMNSTLVLNGGLNEFAFSEEYGNAAWTKTNMTVNVNQATPPYGNADAVLLLETAANAAHCITQAVTGAWAPFNQNAVVKYYGGGAARQWVQIAIHDSVSGSDAYWNFDILNGVVGAYGESIANKIKPGAPSIDVLGNGWYRIRANCTGLTPPGPYTATCSFASLTANTASYLPTFAGDAAAGFYITESQAGYYTTDGMYNYNKTAQAASLATGYGFQPSFDEAAYTVGDINGKDGWTVAGTGTSAITAGIGYDGSQGLRIATAGAFTRSANHAYTFPVGKGMFSFRMRINSLVAGSGLENVSFLITNGATAKFSIGAWLASSAFFYYNGAVNQQLTTGERWVAAKYYQITLVYDRTTVASTNIRVFISDEVNTDCREALNVTVDTTNADTIKFQGNSAAGGTTSADFDDFRAMYYMAPYSFRDTDFDMGATAVSTRGTLQVTGSTYKIERIITGAFHPVASGDANIALKDAAARTKIGNTFTPTTNGQMDVLSILLAKVGAPVGNVWIEIWTASGGNPGVYLTRSKSFDVSALGTANFQDIRFEFPRPVYGHTNVQYFFVLNSDIPVSGANYLITWADAAASTYAGGQYFAWNGAAWGGTATVDMCFTVLSSTEPLAWIDPAFAATDTDYGGGAIQKAGIAFRVGHRITGRHHCWIEAKKKAGSAWAGTEYIRAVLYAADANYAPTGAALGYSNNYKVDTFFVATYQMNSLSLEQDVALAPGNYFIHFEQVGTWGANANLQIAGVNPGAATLSLEEQQAFYDNGAGWVNYGTTNKFCGGFGIECRPWVRWSAFYDAGANEAAISYNETRQGSLATYSFNTPVLARTWTLRQYFVSKPCHAATGLPFSPTILSATFVSVFRDEKYLDVDLTQAASNKTVNLIRIWAHPTEGGLRKFVIQGKAHGGAYADFTDVDSTIMQARKKGGTATITYNSTTHEFTTDGDSVELRFAEHTIRNIKVLIRDNIDGYARIVSIEARRAIDVSDRVCAFKETRPGEFRNRRVKGVKIDFDLKNDDGYLSSEWTDGPYYGQLGAGVEFVPWIGMYGAQDYLRLGTFYVDDWNQTTEGPDIIKLSARDGVKIMSIDVNANYKQNYRHDSIIEYLGNLAGISSCDMRLDKTASRVAYFAPTSVNAYEESQKVAEACGYGMVGFDAQGYFFFRATGTIGGNTGMESTTNLVRLFGPPVEWNGKVYILGAVTNGGNQDLKLFAYDMDTCTWGAGVLISTKGNQHSGMLAFYGNALWVLDFDADAAGAAAVNAWLWKSTDAATFTRVGTVLAAKMGNGPAFTGYAANYVDSQGRWSFAGRTANWDNAITQIDLQTYQMELLSVTVGGSTVHVDGLNNNLAMVSLETAGSFDIYIYQWDGVNGISNGLLMVAASGAIRMRTLGFARAEDDSNGYVYYCSTSCSAGPAPARLFKIRSTVGGTIDFTALGTLDTAEEGTPFDDCDGLGYADGVVVSGWTKKVDGTNYHKRLMWWDSESGYLIDGASVHMAQGRFQQFRSVTRNSQNYIYGIVDSLHLFEIRARVRRAYQTTSVLTISDDAAGEQFGALMNAQLEAGDDGGGISKITNVVVAESAPLVEQASTTIWQADNLPWAIKNGDRLEYKVKLEKPCAAPQTVSITYGSGGAGSGGFSGPSYINTHAQEPTLKINVSASGTITALSIAGKPLVAQATLISIITGPLTSLNRYKTRMEKVANDYIYDGFQQNIIGLSIVMRLSFPKAYIRGVTGRAFWHLEQFDRITLKERKRLRINADYYIASMTRDYMNQTASYEVEAA